MPVMKKKPLLKDQLEKRQKAFAASTAMENMTTSSCKTSVNTLSNKNQPRMAHTPKSVPIPSSIPSSFILTLKDATNRKLPINLRMNILDKLFNEFVKFMPRSQAIETVMFIIVKTFLSLFLGTK